MSNVKNNTMDIKLQNLGSLLKSLRIERGLKQSDVAERVGVSTQHYSRIERGEYIPSLQTFFSLVEMFDIDISKLKLKENNNISSTMYEILKLLEKFNNTQQQAVLAFLKTMEPVTT